MDSSGLSPSPPRENVGLAHEPRRLAPNRGVEEFFGASSSRPSKRMRPVIPSEIVLKETYYNKAFLTSLSRQAEDSPIDEDKYVKPAAKILKRVSASSSSTLKYHQIEYQIGAGQTVVAGRFYPHVPCYQSLPGTVRRIVADDQYSEIDLENAHPNILLDRFPDMDGLRAYIEERDDVLEEVERLTGVSRGKAKELFIRLVFGGTVDSWRQDCEVSPQRRLPDIVKQFSRDIAEILGLLSDEEWFQKYIKIAKYRSNSKKFRGKKWESTAISLWLQDVEAEIMVSAIAELQRQGVSVASLIHDGALIASSDVGRVCLSTLNQTVRRETGVRRATFKVKSLEITDTDKEFVDTVEEGGSEEALTDKVACLAFLRHLKENGYNLISCAKRIYLYDPSTGIYEDRSDLSGFRKLLGETPNIGNYSESSSKKSALLQELVDHIPVDKLFLIKASDCSRLRLPFNNGIFDFSSGALIPYSPDVVFFYKMPFDYVLNARVQEVIGAIMEKVVLPVWGDCADYVLKHTARCMAGCATDKRFIVCTGFHNSGKGLWCELMEYAFPGFVGCFTNSNLLMQPNVGGDQAKANSWLLDIFKYRFVFSNELSHGKNSKIDANKLKMLSSGGDTLKGRSNHKDEVGFKLQCMPWLFVNDLPEIQNVESDPSLALRLRMIRMPSQFLQGAEYERCKAFPGVVLGDEWVKTTFVKDPEVAQAFAVLVTQHFLPDPTPDCPAVAAETELWTTSQEDGGGSLFDKLFEKGDPTDFVVNSVAKALMEDNGQTISIQVLGKSLCRLFGCVSTKKSVKGEKKNVYMGLRLRSNKPAFDEGDGGDGGEPI